MKWATCNVGASSPEKYGYYFAWGETAPKAEYTVENSIAYGEDMNDISGNPQYDAARANWGGSWRMPTEDEMEELVTHCEWGWTQVKGVSGCKVIGPNGRSIFLPAAGYRRGSSLYDSGSGGLCWSSTPCGGNWLDGSAYSIRFYSNHLITNYNGRDFGVSVRPVSE